MIYVYISFLLFDITFACLWLNTIYQHEKKKLIESASPFLGVGTQLQNHQEGGPNLPASDAQESIGRLKKIVDVWAVKIYVKSHEASSWIKKNINLSLWTWLSHRDHETKGVSLFSSPLLKWKMTNQHVYNCLYSCAVVLDFFLGHVIRLSPRQNVAERDPQHEPLVCSWQNLSLTINTQRAKIPGATCSHVSTACATNLSGPCPKNHWYKSTESVFSE